MSPTMFPKTTVDRTRRALDHYLQAQVHDDHVEVRHAAEALLEALILVRHPEAEGTSLWDLAVPLHDCALVVDGHRLEALEDDQVGGLGFCLVVTPMGAVHVLN